MRSDRGNLDGMDVVDPYAPKVPPGQDQLPCEDGEPMETERHREQMNLLIETLRGARVDPRELYVAGNMFVYFSELQTRGETSPEGGEWGRGPDVFVVLDTDGTKERKSWVPWEEGGKLPDVVIELLSATTEKADRGDKKRIYERIWKAGHYVLFDPETLVLEGFVLREGRYEPLARDANGDIPIKSLGRSLGVRAGTCYGHGGEWLRWIDEAGAVLPTDGERAARAEAQLEEARRELAELEAKLRERG